jgi:hypothetical protein
LSRINPSASLAVNHRPRRWRSLPGTGSGPICAPHHAVALVEFQAHYPDTFFWVLVDHALQDFHLRGKPEPVVDQLGVFGNQGVAQVHHLAVHGDGFHGQVRLSQNGAAGGFVDPAGFHSHEPVFHDVDTADAVLAPQFGSTRPAWPPVTGPPSMATGSPFEGNSMVSGVSGASLGASASSGEHLLRRAGPGVFQHPALVADVQQVAVGAVGFGVGGGHRRCRAFGKGHQRRAGIQVPFAPGGDDLNVGIDGQIAQLETDLVVALAGGAVADGIGALRWRRSPSGAWRSAAGRWRSPAGTAPRRWRWPERPGRRNP